MKDMLELMKIIRGEKGDWAKGDRKTCPDCGYGGEWMVDVMAHSRHCWIEWHLSMGKDYWDAISDILDLLWPQEKEEIDAVRAE